MGGVHSIRQHPVFGQLEERGRIFLEPEVTSEA